MYCILWRCMNWRRNNATFEAISVVTPAAFKVAGTPVTNGVATKPPTIKTPQRSATFSQKIDPLSRIISSLFISSLCRLKSLITLCRSEEMVSVKYLFALVNDSSRCIKIWNRNGLLFFICFIYRCKITNVDFDDNLIWRRSLTRRLCTKIGKV